MVSYDIRVIDADGEYTFNCDTDCTSSKAVMRRNKKKDSENI